MIDLRVSLCELADIIRSLRKDAEEYQNYIEKHRYSINQSTQLTQFYDDIINERYRCITKLCSLYNQEARRFAED